MRIFFACTPMDTRSHLDGTRLAVADLAAALLEQGHTPIVPTCSLSDEPWWQSRFTLPWAIAEAKPDVVHAVFQPRRRTLLPLKAVCRALQIPLVQSIPSLPSKLSGLHVVRGCATVGSTWAAQRVLVETGIRTEVVPLPFAAPHQEPYPSVWAGSKRHVLLLYAGDAEGEDLPRTVETFRSMTLPTGVEVTLALACRTKGKDLSLSERWAWTSQSQCDSEGANPFVTESWRYRHLGSNKSLLQIGEVSTLLPWIRAARAVLLPAKHLRHKLDHPRVLLESIALGIPILVGSAPSLVDLAAPGIGTICRDVKSIRRAMEESVALPFVVNPIMQLASRRNANAILKLREPSEVATKMVEMYNRAMAAG